METLLLRSKYVTLKVTVLAFTTNGHCLASIDGFWWDHYKREHRNKTNGPSTPLPCQQTVCRSFKTSHCALRQSNVMAPGTLIFTKACSAHVDRCLQEIPAKNRIFYLNQKVNGSIFQHICETGNFKVTTLVTTLWSVQEETGNWDGSVTFFNFLSLMIWKCLKKCSFAAELLQSEVEQVPKAEHWLMHSVWLV